jgi:hypothetical protein
MPHPEHYPQATLDESLVVGSYARETHLDAPAQGNLLDVVSSNDVAALLVQEYSNFLRHSQELTPSSPSIAHVAQERGSTAHEYTACLARFPRARH